MSEPIIIQLGYSPRDIRRAHQTKGATSRLGRSISSRAIGKPNVPTIGRGRRRRRGLSSGIDIPTGGKPGNREATGSLIDVDSDGWAREGSKRPVWVGLNPQKLTSGVKLQSRSRPIIKLDKSRPIIKLDNRKAIQRENFRKRYKYRDTDASGKIISRTNGPTWLKDLSNKQISEILVPDSIDTHLEMWLDSHAAKLKSKDTARDWFFQIFEQKPWLQIDYSEKTLSENRKAIQTTLDESPIFEWAVRNYGAPIFSTFTKESVELRLKSRDNSKLYEEIKKNHPNAIRDPEFSASSLGGLEMVAFNPNYLINKTSWTSNDKVPSNFVKNKIPSDSDVTIEHSIPATLIHEWAHWYHNALLLSESYSTEQRMRPAGAISNPSDSNFDEKAKIALEYDSHTGNMFLYANKTPLNDSPEEPRTITSYGHTSRREMFAEGMLAYMHPNEDMKTKAINKKLKNDIEAILMDKNFNKSWLDAKKYGVDDSLSSGRRNRKTTPKGPRMAIKPDALSSGKKEKDMPAFPRKPTYGPLLDKANDKFGSIKTWQEFKDVYEDTEITYLDYETTGLVMDEFNESSGNGFPTQIGAIKTKNGEITSRFNVYVNPGIPLDKWEQWSRDNLKDSNNKPYTDDFIQKQISIAEAHKQLAEFIGPNALLGVQNAAFDKDVLEDSLTASGIDWRPDGWIDLKDVAEMSLPRWSEKNQDGPKKFDKEKNTFVPSNSLKNITEYLGVELGDKHHTADADAEATAQSMKIIIDKAIKNNWSTDLFSDSKRKEKLKREMDEYYSEIINFRSNKNKYIQKLENANKENSSSDSLPDDVVRSIKTPESDLLPKNFSSGRKLTPEQRVSIKNAEKFLRESDLKITEIDLVNSKTGAIKKTPIFVVGGRPMVLVEVNGVLIPFYRSSGWGGKQNVPSRKWYPIFGISREELKIFKNSWEDKGYAIPRGGWFNKSNEKDILDYYGLREFKDIAEELNIGLRDLTDISSDGSGNFHDVRGLYSDEELTRASKGPISNSEEIYKGINDSVYKVIHRDLNPGMIHEKEKVIKNRETAIKKIISNRAKLNIDSLDTKVKKDVLSSSEGSSKIQKRIVELEIKDTNGDVLEVSIQSDRNTLYAPDFEHHNVSVYLKRNNRQVGVMHARIDSDGSLGNPEKLTVVEMLVPEDMRRRGHNKVMFTFANKYNIGSERLYPPSQVSPEGKLFFEGLKGGVKKSRASSLSLSSGTNNGDKITFKGKPWKNKKNTLGNEQIFPFSSQVVQYPQEGPSGISYFRGEDDYLRELGWWVDALLYRDENGKILGILNHYPQNMPAEYPGGPSEKKGNINIFINPNNKKSGIGTALLEEAIERYDVDLNRQRYSEEGANFVNKFVRKLPENKDKPKLSSGKTNKANRRDNNSGLSSGATGIEEFKNMSDEKHARILSEAGLSQRGEAEEAGQVISEKGFSGLYQYALEHIGDLYHRAQHRLKYSAYGLDEVDEKITKILRYLRQPYGFEREVKEQIDGQPELSMDVLKSLGKKYADAHSKLPVYNLPAELMVKASMHLGNWEFKDATKTLEELREMLKDEKKWKSMFSRQGTIDYLESKEIKIEMRKASRRANNSGLSSGSVELSEMSKQRIQRRIDSYEAAVKKGDGSESRLPWDGNGKLKERPIIVSEVDDDYDDDEELSKEEKESNRAYIEFSKISLEEMAERTRRAEESKQRLNSPEYLEQSRLRRVARNKGKETNTHNADGTLKIKDGEKLSSGSTINSEKYRKTHTALLKKILKKMDKEGSGWMDEDMRMARLDELEYNFGKTLRQTIEYWYSGADDVTYNMRDEIEGGRISKEVNELLSLIDISPVTSRPVYRGMRYMTQDQLDEIINRGVKLPLGAFSGQKTTALSYADGDPFNETQVSVVLRLEPGVKAFPMKHFSPIDEEEYLVNGTFEVVGVSQTPVGRFGKTVTEVELKEIEDKPKLSSGKTNRANRRGNDSRLSSGKNTDTEPQFLPIENLTAARDSNTDTNLQTPANQEFQSKRRAARRDKKSMVGGEKNVPLKVQLAIIEDYKDPKKTIHFIAKKHNVDKTYVSRLVRQYNIPYRKNIRQNLTGIQQANIVEAIKNSMPNKEIMKKFNISQSQFFRIKFISEQSATRTLRLNREKVRIEKQNEEVIKLFNEGVGLYKISERTGRTPKFVRELLLANEETRPKLIARKEGSDLIPLVRELLKNGLSISEIANTLKTHYAKISKIVNRDEELSKLRQERLMSKYAFTPIAKELREFFINGGSIPDAMEKFNLSKEQIDRFKLLNKRKAQKQPDIPQLPDRRRTPAKRNAEIAEYYAQGATIKELMEMFGLARGQVYRILRNQKMGVDSSLSSGKTNRANRRANNSRLSSGRKILPDAIKLTKAEQKILKEVGESGTPDFAKVVHAVALDYDEPGSILDNMKPTNMRVTMKNARTVSSEIQRQAQESLERAGFPEEFSVWRTANPNVALQNRGVVSVTTRKGGLGSFKGTVVEYRVSRSDVLTHGEGFLGNRQTFGEDELHIDTKKLRRADETVKR